MAAMTRGDGFGEDTAGAAASTPVNAGRPVIPGHEPPKQGTGETGRGLDIDGLYRAQVRPIYAFIYAKVGNREAAEDLTSEVFLRALAHMDTSRPEHSVIAWLYRVARNAVNDYWRKGHGAPVIALAEARMGLAPAAVFAADQERAAARAQAVLKRLPENYRQVLSCRLLDGLSVAETAKLMGTSVGNVKVLQHRALKRAAELREDDQTDER